MHRGTAYLRAALTVCFVVVGLGGASAQGAAQRVALVIGNSKYEHTRALPNAATDATAIGIAFERIGFRVRTVTNVGHVAMVEALRRFGREAAQSDMAVVFFAGHGLEVSGENWLVPINAELRHERDLQYEAINLKLVLESVADAKRLRLVILDACRNNPLGERMQVAAGATRAVGSRGLGRVEPPGDVLVAYSAKHGTVAEDGPPGGQSPFASSLVEHLQTGGLDIRIMFGRVIDDVRRRTGGKQEPFTYGSIGGTEVALLPAVPGGSPRNNSTLALEAWRRIESSREIADFRAYIAQFAESAPFYAREAEKRVTALELDAQQSIEEQRQREILRQRESALKAREREIEEARIQLKEQELRQRERELEEERQRRASASNEAPPDRSLTTPPPISGPTVWSHNGSTLRLVSNGATRRFYYDDPRPGMRDEGVTSGTLLFEGTRTGDRYTGVAFVFSSRCGRRSYPVAGAVGPDQRSVVLHGEAPRLGASCERIGSRIDTLVFELLPGQ